MCGPFFIFFYFLDKGIQKLGFEGGFFVSRGAKPESLGFGAVALPVTTSAFINPTDLQVEVEEDEDEHDAEQGIEMEDKSSSKKKKKKKKPQAATGDDEF